jgi:putative tryptophan/tyrosine transport system substrate-binding protein
MKQSWHITRRLGLGLALIAACATLLLISDLNQGRRTTDSLPRVAILTFSSQIILEEGVRGLVDSLRDHGYIQGRTMQLQMFNSENDVPTANSMARELTGGRFDYVFSVSTNCLQAVAKLNKEGRVKHVFGVVADPLAAGVGINPKDPLDHPKNMVGIGTLAPVDKLLEIAKRMNPQLKRVGLPWNPSQANSESYTKVARAACPSLGIELLEGTVDSTPATGEVVDSLLARGAEVILVTGDMTVSLAIDVVVAEATKGGVPVISTQPETAARGVLIAMGGDYYQIGRETGDLAARVLGGEDMSRIPVQYHTPTKTAINRNAAAKLKNTWVFPPDVLAKAAEASGGAASATATGNTKPIAPVTPSGK